MGNKIKEIYKIIDWELVGIPKKKMEVAELIWSKMSEHFPKDEEKPKYDFVCPHSGYGFNEGDESYYISCNHKDSPKKNGGWFSLTNYYAYFPTSELAIQWNKERFGEKELTEAEKVREFCKPLRHHIEPIKEEETRYWECLEGDLTYLTKGKIYCLVEGKNIECLGAFIDNQGENNGFYPYNKDYFKPSTKEAYDKQEGKSKPFEITYKEGCTTTFGGVKYTLGHGKWIREESKTLEERVTEPIEHSITTSEGKIEVNTKYGLIILNEGDFLISKKFKKIVI